MIRKYIWPLISPIFVNKRLEPLFVAIGLVLIVYAVGYTIMQVFGG
jgi:hypothetical protein